MTELSRKQHGRRVTVALVAAITAAIGGYLTGTARTASHGGYTNEEERNVHAAPAPAQADMARARFAERNAQLAAAFDRLGPAPERSDSATTDEARRAMRDARRAYEGAPPTLPHAVDQRGVPACLACHQDGMTVNGRVAPRMTHDPHASCLQCHAPASGVPLRQPLPPSVSTESDFVGIRTSGSTSRGSAR